MKKTIATKLFDFKIQVETKIEHYKRNSDQKLSVHTDFRIDRKQLSILCTFDHIFIEIPFSPFRPTREQTRCTFRK